MFVAAAPQQLLQWWGHQWHQSLQGAGAVRGVVAVLLQQLGERPGVDGKVSLERLWECVDCGGVAVVCMCLSVRGVGVSEPCGIFELSS